MIAAIGAAELPRAAPAGKKAAIRGFFHARRLYADSAATPPMYGRKASGTTTLPSSC